MIAHQVETEDQEGKDRMHIVIVGGGIIGSTTAYYLTRREPVPSVTVIEAEHVASGASGKAGGLLGTFAYPKPLSTLSWQLHHALAEAHDGAQLWQFRRNETLSVSLDAGGAKRSKGMLPRGLDWVRAEQVLDYDDMGATAQVHPRLFTQTMAGLAVAARAEIVHGRATGVTSSQVTFVDASGAERTITADRVVVAAGPWTPRVLPAAPIVGLRAHSITVRPAKPVSAHALFTELRIGRKQVSPEFYAREDEVYICGEGDTTVPLPDSTAGVAVVAARCDELKQYADCISAELEQGEVLVRQACYLPIVESGSGPIIGETKDKIWVAAGHTCWGICNAPATGKLMSQMLFGEETEVDISSLHPSRYGL